ncbi:MAG: class I SAM-dependent methyltransferase, partial [Sciscionella sp.]
HQPFLARLRERVTAAGIGERIRILAADMRDLPLPDGCADLVWAEGSAYLMGFDQALASWRRLLRPHGVLVLTEADWTTPHPATGAREFWEQAYPGMRSTAANVAAAQDAGWTVAATYLLPDSDWAGYYDPLAARLAALSAEGVDPEVLSEIGDEIQLRRDHGGDYGYTGYVLRPR